MLTAWALWPRTPADASGHPAASLSTGAGQLGGAPGRSVAPTAGVTTVAPPATSVGASITASPSPSAAASVTATATVPRLALSASYRAVKGVLGYDVKVTIKNPNPTDVRGWLVTLKLTGLKLLVSNVKGANLEVRGDGTYLFTPAAATLTVPAGGSVAFTFSVTGLSGVASCAIDGQSCSG